MRRKSVIDLYGACVVTESTLDQAEAMQSFTSFSSPPPPELASNLNDKFRGQADGQQNTF
jgi:hypothetical protein